VSDTLIRLLADENFDRRIVRGVIDWLPDLDIIRVQDMGLEGREDPSILEWAAGQGRIILTHDVSTMTKWAYQRTAQGLFMPGVWEVKRLAPVSRSIEAIVIAVSCSEEDEWEGQVLYLPF
jgi:hypothetical protein